MQTSDTLDRAIGYANHVGGMVCALSGQTNGYPAGHRRATRGYWHAVMLQASPESGGGDMLVWWPEDDDNLFRRAISGAHFAIAVAPYGNHGCPNRHDDPRSVTDASARDIDVWYVAGYRLNRTPPEVTRNGRPLPVDDTGAVFLRRVHRAQVWDMPRSQVYFLTLADYRSIAAVEWVWDDEDRQEGHFARVALPDRLAGIGHRSDPFARDIVSGKVV